MNELLVNTKEKSSVITFNFECLHHRTPIKNILKLDVKLWVLTRHDLVASNEEVFRRIGPLNPQLRNLRP